ncbi:MAG: right-handed parallel beta-helix repeat-containing protein [Flavobacteriales bacterium]|nr:right-handed parallel beta-helix repeat-containing protein [Flavobacteriales bacterium]
MQAVKRILVWALMAGIAMVALWALFTRESLRERYAAADEWMGAEERGWYRELFGLKGPELTSPDLPVFELRTAEGDTCFTAFADTRWHAMTFMNAAVEVPVRVRRLRTQRGGYLVRMPRQSPYQRMERVVLLPADLASIRDKYMQVLAAQLGLFAPELGLVRLSACGQDLGVFVTEERPDAGAMEKRGMAEALPFEQGASMDRPEHAFPDVQDSAARMVLRCLQQQLIDDASSWPEVIDPRTAAGVLLMMVADARYDLLSEAAPMAYDRATGEVLPLWRARRSALEATPQRVRAQFLTMAWTSPAVEEALVAWVAQARPDALRGLWAAVDEAWLPALSGGAPDHARELADAWKEEILARMNMDGMREVIAALAPLVPPPVIGQRDSCQPVRWAARSELLALATRIGARMEGDTLVFGRDRYVIQEDLILPPGVVVRMERSARVLLAPGRSLLIQGPLHIHGTSANPVFIRPLEEKQPFGTVAVLGPRGGPVPCEVSGLRISGGQGATVAGVTFTGMLAMHRATVRMTDCEVHASRGEDAVNIKRSTVELRDCRFTNGEADLLDLDQVNGTITGCTFSESRSEDNGDGLDVSGGRLLVQDCRFERLPDKGVSVGEGGEVLITGCQFISCGLAIAVKDGSVAHVGENRIASNKLAFAVYRKKPVWDGATLVRYPNQLRDNRSELEVDPNSAVHERELLDSAVWRGFGVVFTETKGRSKRDRADAPSPSRRNREAGSPQVEPAPADTTRRRASSRK